ncbi:MAG: putative selenate ABC transporter substrate-binding protein [Nitrosomonadales bacterium]|nr:putative selenate ABC transporter substrate-binding protein [Nitrosomonadales bacterium]
MRLRNLLISLAVFVGLVFYASTYSVPVLRVSVMSEESPPVLRRKLKPLIDYLEKKIGMKIEFRPAHDGDTLVDALLDQKMDMVWLDGFYFIRAKARSNDQVIPLVQRAEDEQSQSVFVTTRADINALDDLKGKRFAFGAETSASGHLMPRSFLLAAYINPDTDMQPSYAASPDATVAAVASGRADAGVLGSASWQQLIEQGRVDPKAVHVFYTTPGYHDYNWTVRADMDFNLRQKLSDAFLALDRNNPTDKEILYLRRASKFIPSQTENYAAIEAAARRAGLLKGK